MEVNVLAVHGYNTLTGAQPTAFILIKTLRTYALYLRFTFAIGRLNVKFNPVINQQREAFAFIRF